MTEVFSQTVFLQAQRYPLYSVYSNTSFIALCCSLNSVLAVPLPSSKRKRAVLRWWRHCCLQNSPGTSGKCRIRALHFSFSVSQSSVPTRAQTGQFRARGCCSPLCRAQGTNHHCKCSRTCIFAKFLFIITHRVQLQCS